MDCSCAIDVYTDDCEPVSLLNIKICKAVKNHKCLECKREIIPGEKYEYASYCYDGSFYHDKTCGDCLSARKQFFPGGGHIDLWFDIREEVENSAGEIPEACIAKLTPVARDRLCDMLNEFYQKGTRP